MRKEEKRTEAEKQIFNSGWIGGYKEGFEAGLSEVDEGYSCDYDEEDNDEFILGFNQGYKKGYLQRLEEEDEEYSDEIDELLEDCDSFREAYDLGVLQGLDDGYLDGYKDCIKGEIPVIENAELQELIEQHYREEYLEEPEYDTVFLAYIKDLQDRISRLHKYSENEDFKREIMDIFHLITVITESQVMQPVYRFWIDLEDN